MMSRLAGKEAKRIRKEIAHPGAKACGSPCIAADVERFTFA